MDTSAIAAASIALSQAKQAGAVQMAMLKMSTELSAQGVLRLLEAAAAPVSAGNPAHLGNLIDTRA